MTAVVRVSRMLYSALIRLYPYRFRTKFASEMEMVFADLLTEAAQAGIGSVIALFLRELRDLPINLIREHWFSNQKEDQMQVRRLRNLALIAGTLLALDWLIGVLCASGILPPWVFFLPNIPFGALYVWLESSWVGTHYEILGHIVGDIESLAVFLFIVVAQSLLYFALLEQWMKKRTETYAA